MELQEIEKIFVEKTAQYFPGINFSSKWEITQKEQIFYITPKRRFTLPVRQQYILDLGRYLIYQEDLFIHEKIRGKNISRKLKEMQIDICKELGIKKIILNNNQNSSYHEHFGFKKLPLYQKIKLKKDLPISKSLWHNPLYLPIN